MSRRSARALPTGESRYLGQISTASHPHRRGWKKAVLAVVVLLSSVVVQPPLIAQEIALPATVGMTPSPRVLAFGAFPSHSLVRLEAFYAPFALYLSEALRESVRFGTGKSYARFRERLVAGEFDIAFVQASDYLSFARAAGYRPLAYGQGGTLVVFSRADGVVRTVEDLRGKRIALPPIEDDSTTVALQRLRALGLEPGHDVTVVHVEPSSACLQFVAAGRSDAAAMVGAALDFAEARAGIEYAVIDAAAPVPAPLFIAAPRLSAEEGRHVREALVAWSQLPANQAHPAATSWMTLTVEADGVTPLHDAPLAVGGEGFQGRELATPGQSRGR